MLFEQSLYVVQVHGDWLLLPPCNLPLAGAVLRPHLPGQMGQPVLHHQWRSTGHLRFLKDRQLFSLIQMLDPGNFLKYQTLGTFQMR